MIRTIKLPLVLFEGFEIRKGKTGKFYLWNKKQPQRRLPDYFLSDILKFIYQYKFYFSVKKNKIKLEYIVAIIKHISQKYNEKDKRILLQKIIEQIILTKNEFEAKYIESSSKIISNISDLNNLYNQFLIWATDSKLVSSIFNVTSGDQLIKKAVSFHEDRILKNNLFNQWVTWNNIQFESALQNALKKVITEFLS